MNFPEHELHFFQKFGLTTRLIERCLGEALSAGGDFADLYFESITSSAISVDESIVKSASQGVSAGCGVRVCSGDRTGYAYTDDLSAERLLRAARTAALIALWIEVSNHEYNENEEGQRRWLNESREEHV